MAAPSVILNRFWSWPGARIFARVMEALIVVGEVLRFLCTFSICLEAGAVECPVSAQPSQELCGPAPVPGAAFVTFRFMFFPFQDWVSFTLMFVYLIALSARPIHWRCASEGEVLLAFTRQRRHSGTSARSAQDTIFGTFQCSCVRDLTILRAREGFTRWGLKV